MNRLLLSSIAGLALAACGSGESSGTTADPVENAAVVPAETMQDDAPAADAGFDLSELGEAYANADLANGARQFRRCQSCHTLNEGGRHTVGPNLFGFMNREAASAEGFNYSPALREAGLVWDVETLDSWLENPRAMVPRNRMSFVGLRDAEARRDVIAHIATQTQ